MADFSGFLLSGPFIALGRRVSPRTADEEIIQRLHTYDWDVFKSDRRFYEKLADINEYVDVCFSKETLDNVRTTEDLLNCIEDEHLLIILERSDRITLEIVALKMQGYAPKEIAKQLKMTRDAVNRRLVRLRQGEQPFDEAASHPGIT